MSHLMVGDKVRTMFYAIGTSIGRDMTGTVSEDLHNGNFVVALDRPPVDGYSASTWGYNGKDLELYVTHI